MKPPNPPRQALDAALVIRAQRGDRNAFAEIVRHHQGAVFRLCWRYVGATEAEDASQETFMKAFVHRERFDPERPLTPWLLTIAKRVCLDRMRKKKPQLSDSPEGPEAVEAGPGADRITDARRQVSRLRAALAKLPEGQREAVSLYHLEGMPYQEIANTLGKPLGTVMTWLHRGRARLKQALSESGGSVNLGAEQGATP